MITKSREHIFVIISCSRVVYLMALLSKDIGATKQDFKSGIFCWAIVSSQYKLLLRSQILREYRTVDMDISKIFIFVNAFRTFTVQMIKGINV